MSGSETGTTLREACAAICDRAAEANRRAAIEMGEALGDEAARKDERIISLWAAVHEAEELATQIREVGALVAAFAAPQATEEPDYANEAPLQTHIPFEEMSPEGKTALGEIVRAARAIMKATEEPATEERVARAGVDSQVWLAAQQMDDAKRRQPEWLWFADDKSDGIPVARYSFGRWAKMAEQAPYIRADLALRAAPAASRIGVGEIIAVLREEIQLRTDAGPWEIPDWGPQIGGHDRAADRILALLAAPRAGGETGDGWRPIETAPKDRQIMLWSGVVMRVGWWSDELDSWQVGGENILRSPTHWRDRPAPPAEQAANHGGGR